MRDAGRVSAFSCQPGGRSARGLLCGSRPQRQCGHRGTWVLRGCDASASEQLELRQGTEESPENLSKSRPCPPAAEKTGRGLAALLMEAPHPGLQNPGY